MAARSASLIKTWFSEPATYPIIGIITFASGMATFAGVRYCMTSPDVTFDKHKRADLFHRAETEGKSFRSHRVGLAHLKANPINQSKLFEGFYERANK